MSRIYGPHHRWFAWRPVDTYYHGWRWLRFVQRQRVFLDIAGQPAMRFWEYTLPCCNDPDTQTTAAASEGEQQ